MIETDKLFKAKQDRLGFGLLAVGSSPMGSNDPLSIEIPAQGVGTVIVPFEFYMHSQISGCRLLLSSVLNPILGELDDRLVRISRIDSDGGEIVGTDTPLQHNSDFDRSTDLTVEVQAVKGSPALDNTALRLEFNGINSTYERQYAYIVYKVVSAL